MSEPSDAGREVSWVAGSWPPPPIAASDGVWRVPKRPAVAVGLILLALWIVPRVGSFVPPETVSLTIANEADDPMIVAILDTDDLLAGDARQASLLIPPGTRAEAHDLPQGQEVAVLVFDEDCRLLTPWPFEVNPDLKPGLAVLIAADGIAAWGDAADGVDVPEGEASSVACPR